MRFFPPRCPCRPGLLSLSTHHRAGTSGRFRAGIAGPMRPDRTALSTGYAGPGGLVVEGLRWNGSGIYGNRLVEERPGFSYRREPGSGATAVRRSPKSPAIELTSLQAIARLNPPILDPLGFVPLFRTGAELLLEVFSQRCERGSILVNINLPVNEWTGVLRPQRLTGTLLGRLTRHVHILEMNGENHCLRRSLATAISQSPDRPDDA